MPYSLTTPSGQVINDIPDDVPQAEALRQLQMRRPELFSKPTSPYSITTPSGQVINDIPADVPREQALENLKRAQPNLFVTQPAAKPGEEALPSQEQADNQTFWRSVADVPLQFQRGALMIAKAGVDMFGAGSEAAQALEKADTHLAGLLSAQAKRDAAEVSRIWEDAKDKGIGDQVLAGLEALAVAPIDLISQALGTAVPTLAAGALTIATGGGALAAGVTAGTVGLGTGMGLIKGEVYDAVKGALKQKNVPEEEAAARAEAAQSYAGENLDLIIAGGGINALAEITGLGKSFFRSRINATLKKSLGKEAAERATAEAAKEEVAKTAARTMPGQAALTAGAEALGEGAQGGYEQLAQNIALQREGFDVPTMRGVVTSGVLEAGAGAPLGAGAGALEVRQARQTLRAMEDADILKEDMARAQAELKERTRLAELDSIITGNPVIATDEQGETVRDENGVPVVSEGTFGRELTEEEQAEYDELQAKLRPTTPVPATPEEREAAVEAEFNRLLKLGYDEKDAQAQAQANIEYQVAEDEDVRQKEKARVDARNQFAVFYDEYLGAGYSEEEATLRALDDLNDQLEAAEREAQRETETPAADVTGMGVAPEVTAGQEAADVIDLGAPVDLTANMPEVALGQFSPGSTATTTIERDGKTTTTTIPARAAPTDVSNTELTRLIERRMDELDAAGDGTAEAAVIQNEINELQAEQRRRRAGQSLTEKTSKSQRDLFEDAGKSESEGEPQPTAKLSRTIEDIINDLSPEARAKYDAAAAEAERQRAKRKGRRGRPPLTEEGTPERAEQKKARKKVVSDNTYYTRVVKEFRERFTKLYRDDGGREDALAATLESGSSKASAAVGNYIEKLKGQEEKLIAEMLFMYEGMPNNIHRRRLGQLLYAIDPKTGFRDKPNPIISADVFERAKRAFKAMREEARQAAAEKRTNAILSKAKSDAKKEAAGRDRRIATVNGKFNNATTVKEALKIVADTAPTPLMRLIAKRISNAVGNARFVVVEKGDPAADKFAGKNADAIGITETKILDDGKISAVTYVRGSSWGDALQGINAITVLHEALHAALDRKILVVQAGDALGILASKAERDFYADIQALQRAAAVEFAVSAKFGTGDKVLTAAVADIVDSSGGDVFNPNKPEEFIAYALSEPVFETFLNSFTPDRSNLTAYGKFVELVRELFKFTKNQVTALTELVSAIDAGISTRSSRKVIQAAIAAEMSSNANKRERKTRNDMKNLAKEQDSVAKGYEESEDSGKVKDSILGSVDLRSSGAAVESLKTVFTTATNKGRRNLAKVLTLPLLAEIAERMGLKSVADGAATVGKMNSMADNILLGAQETLDNTFRTFQGRPKAMSAFTRLALQSTLLNIDPSTNFSSPQLNKLYAALDEKGKREYIRMRDYFQGMTQMYTRFLDDRVNNLGLSAKEEANVLEKIKAMYETGAKIYPFFPLKRFGDYWIRIGTGKDRKFFTFESEFARDQAVKKFAKARNMTVDAFLDQKEGTKSYAKIGNKINGLRGELFSDNMAKTLQDIFNAIDAMDSADADAKEKLKDDVYQTYLATLPDQSIRKQFLHREGITGYSTDFLRSFVEAATHNAFQLSRIKYGPELRRAASAGMKAAGNDIALQVLAEEFDNRTDYNLNTFNESPEQKFLRQTVSFLNQSSFIYYLSAIASPMLQMFQLGITGFNTLGANYGFTNATAEISKLAKVWNQYSVFKKNDDGSVTITAPSLARSKAVQINDRERNAMEKLLRHDVVRVTLAAEITELSKVPLKSLEGSFSQSAKQIVQIPGKMMQATEQLAREMLALTAYRLAYKKHGNHEAAVEEAAFHVSDAMGNYAAYARPPFMRGPLGGLMFQFMMFPVQMTGWFVKNFARSIPFLKANKEGKMLAFKLWASSMASLWIVAGTAGLPFGLGTMMLGVLNQLFDEAKDDDDFPEEYKDMDFDFYVRKIWLPSQVGHIKINDVPLDMIIDYGPLSALSGVDFSSRLSMNGMFIRENKAEATLEAEWQNALIDRMGPAVNMITSFVKGIDALRVGDVQKFGEKIAPAALRAPMYAEKYSKQGIVDWEGTVLTPADQVELGKLLAQAIGFRPLELTEQGYRTFTQRAVEQAIQYEKNRIYTRLYRAYVADDMKEFKRLLVEDVEKFNQKHKFFRIKDEDIERSLEGRFEQRAIKQETGGFNMNERNAPLILPLIREK